MSSTQVQRRLSDGVVYSDPADPSYTVRFKTASAPKSLSGNRTTNYVTEIIVNDNNGVSVNGVNTVDAVSIRIRVSGAKESMTRIKAILADISGQVPTWNTEHVLEGFEPTTAPNVVP